MQELLDFEFDHKYMMRGLIIDKKRGNVLKMDRHKYVKIAFHGFKQLSREERLATYALQRVSPKPSPQPICVPEALTYLPCQSLSGQGDTHSQIVSLPFRKRGLLCSTEGLTNVQERMEFDEPDFALIDTLFSLAEAHLFMQLIEMQDNNPEKMPPGKTCADIYR